MAFEQLRAEIGLLLAQTGDVPEDRHVLYQRIRQKFGEMRAVGMPVPQDLVDLETELEAEFEAEMRSEPSKPSQPS